MRKSLCATFVATFVLGVLAVAGPAAATEQKPVIVVSFAGYDQLVSSVKVVGGLAGRPEVADMLEGLVMFGTGGRGLAGLDKARPWGLAVYAGEEGKYPIQGFIPATDLKKLISLLPPPGANGKLVPDAEGVYEIEGKGQTMYTVQKGPWALVADSREGLKTTPAAPAALLGNLSKKYLLAVQASVQNVPAETRDQFLAQMKMMLDLFTQQKSDESDEQFAARSGMIKQLFAQLHTLSNELDNFVLGLGVDAHTNSIYLDFEITALPGTKTAKQLASAKDAKTNLAGFLLPGAAMTAISAGTSSDADVAQAKTMLAELRTRAIKELDAKDDLSQEKRDLGKQVLDDVLDVLNKTLDTKKSDAGMALLLDGNPTIVAGAVISDAGKLEKSLKRLLAETPEQVGAALKIKEDTYEGVMFHVATVPVADEKAAALFGKQVKIAAGFGKNVVYVGAGKDPLKALKQVIDGSKKAPGKSVPAMQLSLAGAPIARFVAQIAPEPSAKENASKIAEILAKSPGKDHVTLTVKAIANGASVRLNVEEGIAKAVGAAAKMHANASADD
jgi:6-phosphogluconolactonase/glucosamine-6-phosphate isomerase/deaminase